MTAYVRRQHARTGEPMGLWHVTKPRHPDVPLLTACGQLVARHWTAGRGHGLGWTAFEQTDTPPTTDRCQANGCRQRWENA
jgi:hypothetical protein